MNKFNWKGYYEPTPKLFRKLGDSLLVVSGTLSAAGIYSNNKDMALVCLGISVFGKILTNFFTDEP